MVPFVEVNVEDNETPSGQASHQVTERTKERTVTLCIASVDLQGSYRKITSKFLDFSLAEMLFSLIKMTTDTASSQRPPIQITV